MGDMNFFFDDLNATQRLFDAFKILPLGMADFSSPLNLSERVDHFRNKKNSKAVTVYFSLTQEDSSRHTRGTCQADTPRT
jgi:hypothetical protein